MFISITMHLQMHVHTSIEIFSLRSHKIIIRWRERSKHDDKWTQAFVNFLLVKILHHTVYIWHSIYQTS